MRSEHFSCGFGHHFPLRPAGSEARLVYNTEIPRGNDLLNRLVDREDMEKSRHAYDRVAERVAQYRARVNALANTAQQAGRSADYVARCVAAERVLLGLINGILPERYTPQTTYEVPQGPVRLNNVAVLMPTYDAATAERHQRARFRGDHDEVADIEANSPREGRIWFIVGRLEAEYRQIENMIAQWERGAGIAPDESLQTQMLAARTRRLNDQMLLNEAAPQTNKLQTIQIAEYREPMTGLVTPAFHLLRLPANVQIVFEDRDGTPYTGTGGGVENIPLSGGARYERFSTAFTAQLDPSRIHAVLTPPGAPRGRATITKDEVNNLIFSFASPPPPSRDDDHPPVDRRTDPPPGTRRTPEPVGSRPIIPEIVNPPPPPNLRNPLENRNPVPPPRPNLQNPLQRQGQPSTNNNTTPSAREFQHSGGPAPSHTEDQTHGSTPTDVPPGRERGDLREEAERDPNITVTPQNLTVEPGGNGRFTIRGGIRHGIIFLGPSPVYQFDNGAGAPVSAILSGTLQGDRWVVRTDDGTVFSFGRDGTIDVTGGPREGVIPLRVQPYRDDASRSSLPSIPCTVTIRRTPIPVPTPAPTPTPVPVTPVPTPAVPEQPTPAPQPTPPTPEPPTVPSVPAGPPPEPPPAPMPERAPEPLPEASFTVSPNVNFLRGGDGVFTISAGTTNRVYDAARIQRDVRVIIGEEAIRLPANGTVEHPGSGLRFTRTEDGRITVSGNRVTAAVPVHFLFRGNRTDDQEEMRTVTVTELQTPIHRDALPPIQPRRWTPPVEQPATPGQTPQEAAQTEARQREREAVENNPSVPNTVVPAQPRAPETVNSRESIETLRGVLTAKIEQLRSLGAAQVDEAQSKAHRERMQALVDGRAPAGQHQEMGINQCLEELRRLDSNFRLPFDDDVTTGSTRLLVTYDIPTNRILLRDFNYRRFLPNLPADNVRNVFMRDCIGDATVPTEGRRDDNDITWWVGSSLFTSPLTSSFHYFADEPSMKIFRSIPDTTEGDCHFRRDGTRQNAYYVDVPGPSGRERWYISDLGLNPRRRAHGTEETNEFTISRLRQNGSIDFSTATHIMRPQVFSATYRIEDYRTAAGETGQWMVLSNMTLRPQWSRAVLAAIERARQEQASEQRDEANMRSFDLPRNEQVGFLAFHQGDLRDPAFSRSPAHLTHLASILHARGYNIALPNGLRFDANGRVVNAAGRESPVHILVERDPRVADWTPAMIIRQRLEALHKQGIRHVYMELACHGSEEGMLEFQQADGHSVERISFKQLMDIFMRFPSMHFTVHTGACFGGWGRQAEQFRKTMLDTVSREEGRITIITQSKPYITNVGDTFDDALRYYIAAGMTVGQAVRAADRYHRMRTHGTRNPEIRRSSPTRPTHSAREDGQEEAPRA